jgi:ABC-2 type transport system ATP-binding protein
VLVNTHMLPDIDTLADRVALLHGGRVVTCGRLAALLARSEEGVDVEVESARPVRLPGVCLAAWDPTTGRSLWWLPSEGPEHVDQLVRDLVGGGVRLCALTPRRVGLETFFARATELAGEPAAAERCRRAAS